MIHVKQWGETHKYALRHGWRELFTYQRFGMVLVALTRFASRRS